MSRGKSSGIAFFSHRKKDTKNQATVIENFLTLAWNKQI